MDYEGVFSIVNDSDYSGSLPKFGFSCKLVSLLIKGFYHLVERLHGPCKKIAGWRQTFIDIALLYPRG